MRLRESTGGTEAANSPRRHMNKLDESYFRAKLSSLDCSLGSGLLSKVRHCCMNSSYRRI
jgi:hypothetical protein